jgi:DDE superfamily endonuclease
VTISVAYTAVLDANRQTVQFVSDLLAAERARRGTRAGTRALGCFAQAVLVLRWFCDGTRLAQLARDNTIGVSTAYRYLHEGIEVLADRKPSLLPIKKPADRALTDDQRQHNWLQAHARARAEQANALLKTTFKALRRVSLSPDVIGALAAAALVLLHIEHQRTT